MDNRVLTDHEVLELTRWNLPSLYNAWEKVAKRDRLECMLNWEDITDFSPQLGTVGGYAVTMEYRCSDAKGQSANAENIFEYLRYIAGIPGPKMVVTHDLEAPNFKGSLFGEVMSCAYRSLGCVGGITDGTARDIDESEKVGFKMLAKRLFVGHGYSYPVRWGNEITVCGCRIRSGDLVFADKYGFMAIPPEDQKNLLAATRFLDSNELRNAISAALATTEASLTARAEAIIEAQKKMRREAAAYDPNV